MKLLLHLLAALSLSAAPKTNVLFCIADDASLDFGAYGCSWVATPNFDRVAREGVLFNRAYTPNAKCAPSRAIILTGRNSWQLEEAANHMPVFPAKFVGWMEGLAANGYETVHTGKGWGPGTTPGRQITGKRYSSKSKKPPARGISKNDYAGNFADFMAARDAAKPWAFWYGTTEPHRGYEFKSGVNKNGRKLSDIPRVPAYWPDSETVRHDMLDYGMEVEHFDNHLGQILKTLEDQGQLENTLVIVTSDHGRPAPRQKGQAYEGSNHIPFAVMWKGKITHENRKVDDFVNFSELAATILDAAEVSTEQAGMQPLTGKSIVPLLMSDKSGQIDPARDHVLVGKERHDYGRPNNGGYPIRGIIKDDFLYLENFEAERWPAGDPITGYLNCDGGPTKTEILNLRRSGSNTQFWELCFGKRPPVEFYRISKDADCINNLAKNPEYQQKMAALKAEMYDKLKAQQDPRILGNGKIFDEYGFFNPGYLNYYEKFIGGKKDYKGWVNKSDYENETLE
jgi:N-sulfoglucosamine sulfohydrolase